MEETKEKSWEPFFGANACFFNDIDCLKEMTSSILPLLKKKDDERSEQLDYFKEQIEKEHNEFTYEMFELFISNNNKLKTADIMFRQSIITTLVTKYDEFLIKVLRVCYEQNPNWLKNPDKSITYKELLEITSIDDYKKAIIENEINSLMHDSHFVQLVFIDSKLKLGIQAEFPYWNDFLEITERRNLFVHTGGIVSSTYISNCKKWNIEINPDDKEGECLSADDAYIDHAFNVFYEISVRITQAITRRLFKDSFDDADTFLINYSANLLEAERWLLAERIFEFALQIPTQLISPGDAKYYFIINKSIAQKYQGKNYSETLNSIDWSPFHPKYHFAIAVLNEDYQTAKKLMLLDTVKDEVTEQGFKHWPLLKDFRKTIEFIEAYKSLYNKDYSNETRIDIRRAIEEHENAENSECIQTCENANA